MMKKIAKWTSVAIAAWYIFKTTLPMLSIMLIYTTSYRYTSWQNSHDLALAIEAMPGDATLFVYAITYVVAWAYLFFLLVQQSKKN